ncbi:MAG TPA: substrate-binding domain-containing protein [bacterium]|nr:substrate-binding domain-containing protein [bacterium]
MSMNLGGLSGRFVKGCVLLLAAVMLVTLVVACQTGAQGGKGETKKVEKITISGAWALYPMMVRWGEEYRKLHPEIRIDISAGGAGKGAADALAGLVDIGMVSRDIKPAELEQGGYFVPVTKDAVFPTMNAGNPALAAGLTQKGLKKQALLDLYIQGKQLSWGEISGTEVKEMVQLYTRSDSCGAAETWAKFLDGNAQEALKGVGVYGDPGVAEAVRRDTFALGFNNLNYAFDASTGKPVEGLVVISLDVNDNGQIDPEEDITDKAKAIAAVQSGTYPSPPARDLNLLTKTEFKEPTKSFVRWILTDGQQFVEEVGYIKLSDTQLAEALAKLGN